MKKSILQTGIQYGIKVAAALIIYFIIMSFFNLSHNISFRFFNILIIISGIYYAVKDYQKTHIKSEGDYLEDIGVGLSSVFFSTVIFSVFMFSYMKYLNPDFVLLIQQNSFGELMNIYIISFSIFIEGLGFGAVGTFITMQWLKTSHSNEVHTI